MNPGLSSYVDSKRFICGNQNRDLPGNPLWQRNVEALMASIEQGPPRRNRATKPARGR
ncbi:MAG: hypothetical protein JWR69_3173 [Pedosphaera sp.]|nr:hypothetical protein [Pedosphaera sp.]